MRLVRERPLVSLWNSSKSASMLSVSLLNQTELICGIEIFETRLLWNRS